MSYSEKSAWTGFVFGIATYGIYLAIMLTRLGDAPLAELPFVWPMLIAMGTCGVLTILFHIGFGIRHCNDRVRKDVRDEEIGRFGENVGQSIVIIGALAALILAMAKVDHFWIANALFLALSVAGILESATRLAAYRRGFG